MRDSIGTRKMQPFWRGTCWFLVLMVTEIKVIHGLRPLLDAYWACRRMAGGRHGDQSAWKRGSITGRQQSLSFLRGADVIGGKVIIAGV